MAQRSALQKFLQVDLDEAAGALGEVYEGKSERLNPTVAEYLAATSPGRREPHSRPPLRRRCRWR